MIFRWIAVLWHWLTEPLPDAAPGGQGWPGDW
jgi:hypothetical protein